MHLLAKVSLKNRALIALVTIVASVFGFISVGNLKQELMPSVQFPAIIVIANYPGASPEVVNNDVAAPIEAAIKGVAGLEQTTATSSTGSAVVMAEFEYGIDIPSTEQKVERAIARISAMLPSSVDPQVTSGSLDEFPIIQIAVTSPEGIDPEETARLVERIALPELSELDGVRAADLVGALGERVTISPDLEKLADEALTIQSIRDALQQSGVLTAAGSIVEDGQQLAVQAGSTLDSVEQLQALPLVRDASLLQARAAEEQAAAQAALAGQVGAGFGQETLLPAAEPSTSELPVITLGEVATVLQEPNPVQNISRVNGEPALTIAITKLPSANTVEVSHLVQDALATIEPSLGGAGMQVIFDQAPYVEHSIETLAVEGVLGLVFAIIVILIFLFSIRATLVTAISIPVSVLLTFIGLSFADYTLNLLTLGALTISIGRVVDDSIVVIENIKRHLTELAPGGDKAKAIMLAVREVAGAITASTVTTIAVFLPMAFVAGMVGELFRPFAFTVSIALAASLLVSLTIIPVLAYWFMRSGVAPKRIKRSSRRADKSADHPVGVAAVLENDPTSVDAATPAVPATVSSVAPEQHHGAWQPAHAETIEPDASTLASAPPAEPETAMQRGYRPIVNWTLKHPAITLVAAALVFGGTLAATPLMKTSFLGDDSQNSIGLTQTLPPGTSLAAQLEQVERVEEAIGEVTGIEIIQVSIGSSGGGMSAIFGGGGDGVVSYSLTTDADADQAALQDEIRGAVESLGEAGEFAIGQSGGGVGTSSSIEVLVSAPDQETLSAASEAVVASLKEESGLKQVESDLATSRPYLAIVVDRAAAAEAGLNEAAVAGLVAQQMQPNQIGQITLENTNVNIYLSLGAAPADRAEVAAISIPTMSGEVRLDSLASVAIADGPVSIKAQDGSRMVTVSALPEGDDLGAAGVAVDAALERVDLPAGTTAGVGGVMSQQTEAFEQLGLALLAAILIVYVVMVATFKSLLQPLLLLVSVPFAATGALILLIVSGIPLGVASLIGVLMLVGIVVTNAIVLVDLINQKRERGEPLRQAVEEGSSLRLRPIIMTALATILALTPMGLGITGTGGFISQPLAVVVIGGLLSSTVLTLVVLPTLYFAVENRREISRNRRAEKRNARDAAAHVGAGKSAGERVGEQTDILEVSARPSDSMPPQLG